MLGEALAAPIGGEIVGGAGTITQHGTETAIIQDTERLAIDWQNFDIGKDERVTFLQPGQSAVALNRILSDNGSEILGQIDANGHVILVNPQGVVFKEGAVINAGGLIASGLQINPEDFMNGDLIFKHLEGTDGAVINSGTINAATGGNVALIGTQVENRGLISAHLSTVTLSSGKGAVLTFDDAGLLSVKVNEAILQSELGDKAAVTNAGQIQAEGGRVLLSANTTRDVFSQAVNWGDRQQARSVTYNDDGSFTLGAGGDVVNSGDITVSGKTAGDVVVLGENVTHSGTIKANAIQGRGGNIELHANTTTKVTDDGLITANAEQGGDITLLGENVGLFDQAAVAATGEKGGGRVLLGGDQEGLNSQIRNAEFAYISENSSVDTSAIHAGDGGVAIIFAEDTTRIYGNLSAKGGATEGDGGFIETSGKRGFSIANTPDVSAVKGNGGHWLIDPFDLTVGAEGDEIIPGEAFESTESGSNVSVESIGSALSNGSNVTIKTGGEGGNITFSSPISVTLEKNVALNLISHNDINIEENIEADGGFALSLYLLANNTSNSNNRGSANFSDDASIKTNGGDFVIGELNTDGGLDSNIVGTTNVDLSGVSINTDSSAGAGRFFVNASGKVTLMKMLNEGQASAEISIIADELNFDSESSLLMGKSINIEAARWRIGGQKDLGELELRSYGGNIDLTVSNSTSDDNDFSGMSLETHHEGSIILNFNFTSSESSNEFKLPKLNASANVTLKGATADEKGFVLVNKEEKHPWESPSWREFSLDGVLTLELGEKGSATIGNINNKYEESVKNLEVLNGNAIDLTTNGSISLGKIDVKEALTLKANGEDIRQLEGASLNVVGSSQFSSNNSVSLNNDNNTFGGTVFFGEMVKHAVLKASEGVRLADMSIYDSSLEVRATGDIAQEGAIRGSNVSIMLASDENITLEGINQFSSVVINKVKLATIRNSKDLHIGGVTEVDTLNLHVEGNLTQGTAIDVNQLSLDISGGTSLENDQNRIRDLSGNKLSGGKISATGLLHMGGLSITANTDINASEVEVIGPVQLTGGADLTFNGVSAITLSGHLQGINSAHNSVTVNGGNGGGIYTISDTASWDSVQFSIVSAEGGGSVQAPNLAATWEINEAYQRDVLETEQGKLYFSGMTVLKGGDKDDTFTFHGDGDNAKQFSEIRGGGGENTLDYSNLQSDVSTTVGGSSPYVNKISEIGVLVGNGGHATLRAPDNATSEWVIGDGENNRITWTLNEAPTVETDESIEPVVPIEPAKPSEGKMAFRGFNNLIGGTGKDDFRVKLQDHLGHYKFDGGGDNVAVDDARNAELNDELSIEGGGADWWGTYGVGQNGVPGFSFSSSPQSEDRTNLSYQGIESVNVEAALGYVELRDETERGEFHLSPGKWQWGGQTADFTPVSYSAALKGLIVYADTISLAGSIHLPERLDLEGKILSVDEAVLLKAGHLHLEDFNGGIGSDKAPLDISVDNLILSLADDAKAVYLREEDGVSLAGLTGGQDIDVKVIKGDITQNSAIIRSTGDLALNTLSGNILLNNESNSIEAPITLEAAATASLRTSDDLQLEKVEAQDLALNAGGKIESTGPIIVHGKAQFESGDGININNAGNRLNAVGISAGGDVEVANQDRISVYEARIGGGLTLKSLIIEFLGLVSAGTLTIESADNLGGELNPERRDRVTVLVKSPVVIQDVAEFKNALVIGSELVHSASGKVFGVRRFTPADQMIELEGLAEIDPAIFTNVKNYVYQDVSILLPSDQLYGELMEGEGF